jgi:CRISPR-associated protein Csm4
MHYYLYKLEFDTPVHFGGDIAGIGVENAVPNCHADTFFSALCHEINLLYGPEEIERWVNAAKNQDFLISDLFPFDQDKLYLPKPTYLRQVKEYERYKSFEENIERSKQKKTMKNLKFIPVGELDTYFDYLISEETEFQPTKLEFFQEVLTPRVALSRDGQSDNDPYFVGAYAFNKNSGLYFIARFNDKAQATDLSKIIESLGLSGIGGERSTGFGKFHLFEMIELTESSVNPDYNQLYNHLTRNNNKLYITLSVISPKADDLDILDSGDNYYTLIPRKGFIESASYSEHPVKRKPIVMFNTGSCFSKPLEGDIPNVNSSDMEKHPVYRYGKAMMVGV